MAQWQTAPIRLPSGSRRKIAAAMSDTVMETWSSIDQSSTMTEIASAVIASEAKQSISPLAEAWIASLRSQ